MFRRVKCFLLGLGLLPLLSSIPEAAEFEVVDKLAVNGYAVLKNSAEIRGLLGVSTGVPYAALDVVSTGTAANIYAQIWRDGSGAIVSSMTSTGVLMAAKFIGDGSGLSGISAGGGDSLGTHVATQTLQMQSYGINTSSNITAARYQINGSTVLARLPGNSSLGVGVDAGNLNSGGYNSFLGTEAGYSNLSGWENSFAGFAAGWSNTTGSDNSFVGSYAGHGNTSGMYNSMFGSYAGKSATTVDNNTAVGYSAGYYNVTGGSNTVVGSMAGQGQNGYSYAGNAIFGYKAGYSLRTGNDNILLGWQAGYSVTTGTGNIVIGYNKGTSAPGANNELNIGGVLYGKLDSRTIGIGTNNPLAALEVRSYSDGNYTAVVSTSATAGVYSVAVTSTGVTNINNFVIENRTSDPAAPVTGQIWFRVD